MTREAIPVRVQNDQFRYVTPAAAAIVPRVTDTNRRASTARPPWRTI